MAIYLDPYTLVMLKDTDEGRALLRPWPTRFMVHPRAFNGYDMRVIIIKATLWGILFACLENLWADVRMYPWRALWVLGLIEPPEAVVLRWRHLPSYWRWNPIETRRNRRRH